MKFWLVVMALLASLAAGNAYAGDKAGGDGVRWSSGDDLYLAGRNIIAGEDVKGSLTGTADTLMVPEGTKIGGNAWLAGRNIAVSGDVGGNLELRGADALVNGKVRGDVLFYGGKLTLGPDADVAGAVRYYATSAAEIDDGSRVGGHIEPHVLAASGDKAVEGLQHPRSQPFESFTERDLVWLIPGYGLSIVGAFILAVLSVIVAFAMPGSPTRLYEAVEEGLALSLLIGALWLFALPILAIVAAVTLIGIPVALLLLLLWPIGIFFGLVAAVLMIGGYAVEVMGVGLDSRSKSVIAAIVGTFLLWFGMTIPVIGGVVWFIAVVAGVGAITLSGRTPVVLRQ
ncbi:MAG: hypothetical protein PW790_13045 [Parvibaculaceae bacterium]|nr:hypothetical protein [Parvibaculaceae bacterium]